MKRPVSVPVTSAGTALRRVEILTEQSELDGILGLVGVRAADYPGGRPFHAAIPFRR